MSVIPREQLLVWPLSVERFAGWLATSLAVEGTQRLVGTDTWQLGTVLLDGMPTECFLCRSEAPDEPARKRMSAYRRTVLMRPLPAPPLRGFEGTCVSLLDVLRLDGWTIRAADLRSVLGGQAAVRFEDETGALWVGNRLAGEVKPGSKEHALLQCLWQARGQYVSYRDIKRFVLNKRAALIRRKRRRSASASRTGSRRRYRWSTVCSRPRIRRMAIASELYWEPDDPRITGA